MENLQDHPTSLWVDDWFLFLHFSQAPKQEHPLWFGIFELNDAANKITERMNIHERIMNSHQLNVKIYSIFKRETSFIIYEILSARLNIRYLSLWITNWTMLLIYRALHISIVLLNENKHRIIRRYRWKQFAEIINFPQTNVVIYGAKTYHVYINSHLLLQKRKKDFSLDSVMFLSDKGVYIAFSHVF